MKVGASIRWAYAFSTKQSPFQTFLASSNSQLTLKRNPGRNSIGSEVHVPRLQPSREAVQAFFQSKDIVNRNVLINIDPSHLLGMRRAVSLEYMAKNVYKGNSDALDVLQKRNPTTFVAPEELMLDERMFAMTDPIFLERAKREAVPIQALMQDIEQYYSKNLERGVQRLESEYLVPPEYLYIIETAHNLGNSVYFVGLNEYELRQIVTSYLSLQEIKILFMEALKYSGNSTAASLFHHRSKELLWKMHYSFLQPINHQVLTSIRRQVKGFCFAHSYHFLQPHNATIDFRGVRDKDPDNAKLEKHAILSILFGDIWNKPYTNNPFPYLAEPFPSLPLQDKRLVGDIYNTFYRKYKAVHDKLRPQVA